MVSAVTRREARRFCTELAVLAEPNRMLMVSVLRRGPCCAGELAKTVGIAPSLASHHLSILFTAGLVTRRRQARFVYYSADRRRLLELHQHLGRLSGATGAVAEFHPVSDADPC